MADQDYTTKEQQYEFISGQHGGYWRHGFIDHAYLYNLHFPPESLLDQLTKQVRDLVLNYPVAQDALADLVGDLIGQPQERIVVGNGASELIKIISGHIAHRLIVPVPSFNEYVNAAPAGRTAEFALDPPAFQLDVDKFAAEAIRCQADLAVAITPNNPTSLLVPKAALIRLAKKLAEHDCMLIVDESFMNFARDGDQETLEGEIAQYPNVAILKSMSKAYGIAGLRIGYLLTANTAFADKVRQGLHIWNVNGFAETFLRLAPLYREEFAVSCDRVRSDRDLFYEQLRSIQGLTVFRPEANFIFCRLPEQSVSGPEVSRRLFIEHNIYIKDCQGKSLPESDRYIRIASRTQAENRGLVEALRDIISQERK